MHRARAFRRTIPSLARWSHGRRRNIFLGLLPWAALVGGCGADAGSTEPVDDATALQQTSQALVVGPGPTPVIAASSAVLDLKPMKVGVRAFVPRKDGTGIPLLTAEEMAQTSGQAPPPSSLPPTPPTPGLPLPGAIPRPAFPDILSFLRPARVDLSPAQTPVKDQLDRGTCGTFATVAAIEAAYKRTYGIELDLSEQYMFHVAKSTGVSYPRIFKYENQSSLWWGGGWPSVARTYRIPLESDAPYAGDNRCPESNPGCRRLRDIPGASDLNWHWDPAMNLVTQKQVDDFEYSPLHIPPAARSRARYGVTAFSEYNLAQARDTNLLESLIAANKEVVISVDLKWRSEGGILDYDPTADSWGGHVFLLIGYDRTAGYFLVKNSWGGSAPDAYLKVSYRFLQNSAYAAATVDGIVPPTSPPQSKARWIGKWYQDHDGWPGTLVVRRITEPGNAPVRLGTYYAGGDYAAGRSANGLSIDDDLGLRFYVASETENAPGTLSGQRFEADQYRSDPEHASGMCWFGTDGECGLHLGRVPLPRPYSNTFTPAEWVGTWDLVTDGLPGVLTVTSVVATPGNFIVNASLTEGGASKPVTGTLDRTRPTIARLSVGGATPTTRTLRHHFWEDKLASGSVTALGATRVGVHATKR